VVAEVWFAISCHRFEMALEEARGKRHGSCSSVRNRPEQGCTNFGYQVVMANKGEFMHALARVIILTCF
jgi:hypothetical protein